ncbi:hypothetical protein ONE63_002461 [Megalurothrips usitatus]|uniref:Uncharacterized protein n=1 Tax=Megalurothrips usitatus TaxID=439358 RepID=A0AAV7XFA8_9NEOP|nr:hypothetical protein ONE63_002461 [Megalurothrips usitatus]
MLLRAACSDRSQRALCVAAMLVLMAGFFSTALRLLLATPGYPGTRGEAVDGDPVSDASRLPLEPQQATTASPLT